MIDISMPQKLKKPRLILDTNIYISALIRPKSHLGTIVKWSLDSKRDLILPIQQVEELMGVVKRRKIEQKYLLSPRTINVFAETLVSAARVVTLSLSPTMAHLPVKVRDPKDELILLCAFQQQIDYLITGD
jgi:putative PIN family toxin of toxin-antitoxin system